MSRRRRGTPRGWWLCLGHCARGPSASLSVADTPLPHRDPTSRYCCSSLLPSSGAQLPARREASPSCETLGAPAPQLSNPTLPLAWEIFLAFWSLLGSKIRSCWVLNSYPVLSTLSGFFGSSAYIYLEPLSAHAPSAFHLPGICLFFFFLVPLCSYSLFINTCFLSFLWIWNRKKEMC